ncbi:MAG: glycosyltransferase family 2 protein, partial [Myxococcota bacterium]
FWKPAFDPVLLSGVNYVNHLSVYRRDRLAALGGLREGFDGSQDYELVLRYTRGLTAEQILHLPYPAYRWRQRAESVSHSTRSVATDRARAALEEHYATLVGPTAATEAHLSDLHHLTFPNAAQPLVSIIIPNRDRFELISTLLDDLDQKTGYPQVEVIVVDNGSKDPRVHALYERMGHRLRLIADIREAPFNFASMVNRGVALSRGDAVLLLNNDISVIEPNWLDEMVACLSYPGTGIVGARLLYPNDTVQHAGVVLGLGGLAGHWYYKAGREDWGEMGRLAVRNGLSAVTGACMLVTRDCWDRLGGMDAERFAVAYNDVDFCARAREAGYGVVWTPAATLYHHESASRGSDLVGEKARRFQREKAALVERHGTDRLLDPCLSPWYSRYQSRPRVVVTESLPAARSFYGFADGRIGPKDGRPFGDRQPMPKSVQG